MFVVSESVLMVDPVDISGLALVSDLAVGLISSLSVYIVNV